MVKVSCLNCGVTNNYPEQTAGKRVVCGRCKSTLPQPGTVIELNFEQASAFLGNAGLPLLVDFYSPTCGPCLAMHPIVDNLARRRAGEIMVVRINVDQNPQIAARFGIQGVPTFLIIHKGRERGRTVGAISEADFVFWVASRV
jgi:thioredoxin 2